MSGRVRGGVGLLGLHKSCRYCGGEIKWAETSDGRKLRLNPPELRYVKSRGGTYVLIGTCTPHRDTCPNADEWHL